MSPALMSAALALMLAYLLGSLSGSLILGRLRGFDIREAGSGNAGGTNALRTRGPGFALGVVLIDVGKGTLAAWIALRLHAPELPLSALGLALAATLVAAAGHAWPLWFGFRGGKGVATLLGGSLLLLPWLLIPLLLTWLVVLGLSGYVGLASICAVLGLLPLAWLDGRAELLPFAAIAAAFVLFTHRDNLRRLRAGSEHRFTRARVLHRWLRR
jgi:acyl phosphate:glycerol-3-phosphate acyltransferase